MALNASQQRTAATLVGALQGILGLEGACGAVGNMMAESGLNPGSYNANDRGKPSAGLCQWRADRFEKLKSMASSGGKSWQRLDVQAAYLKKELNGPYKSCRIGCSSASTPERASEIWGQKFEKFAGYKDLGGREHTRRKKFSREIYNGIKNGKWTAGNLVENTAEAPAEAPAEEPESTAVYVAEGGNNEYSGPSNTPSPDKGDFKNITGYGIDWENDDSLIVFEKEPDGGDTSNSSNFTPMTPKSPGTKPPTLSQKFGPSISISEHSVFATKEDVSDQHSISEGASIEGVNTVDTFAV